MTAIAAIKAIGTPDALQALSASSPAPSIPAVFNAHIHVPPNFSAFTTVDHAVSLACDQGCVLLGTSNYYDFTVYNDFAKQCKKSAIFPLFGLEMLCRDEDFAQQGIKVNDPGNPGKVYVCGKGLSRFSSWSPAATLILEKVRGNDSQRIAQMVERCVSALREKGCALPVTVDSIIDGIVQRHNSQRATIFLQERHVAQAIQHALFEAIPATERLARLPTILGGALSMKQADDAVALQNDVRNHLMKSGKPGFVAESYITIDEARRLALELGGIPCYPILADGANPINHFESSAQTLIDNLKALHIVAAEFIPNRNTPALLVEYATALRRAGIIVTAGTEHNTPELLPILPSAKGSALPAQLVPLFWEGACVVAAHQFLTAHDKPGYVLSDGTLNPYFAHNEERISYFYSLGAAVIATWRQA